MEQEFLTADRSRKDFDKIRNLAEVWADMVTVRIARSLLVAVEHPVG